MLLHGCAWCSGRGETGEVLAFVDGEVQEQAGVLPAGDGALST
jgi:hypothetical protein